ncbi:MAG: hypothetical protein P9M05_02335 [Candidatus Stygibacter australis]|nr:hypothetical protein [Candidatus Stygibacter australis]
MKEILQDIIKKLLKGAFQNEEQVRFSLVSRILLALGWDIWNPNEVVTEYPVKKFPKKDINIEESGRVDIALFMNNHSDRTPEVFLEIKAPGKLTRTYSDYEDQLKGYNFHDRSAISILTDGIEWKFYLPSAGGSFDQRLFNEFNLQDNDIDYIILTLQEVLHKDNFRRKAIQSGERMLEEMKLINMIANVKEEAQSIAKTTGYSRYEVAQKILKNKYRRLIPLNDIERFWERIAYAPPDLPNGNEPDHEIKGKSVNLDSFNPTGKKPKRVFIINKWYDITSWRKMYILVCEALIKRHPDTDLGEHAASKPIWKKGSEYQLSNGKYINACKSANSHLMYSKKILNQHNYIANDNLKIEI